MGAGNYLGNVEILKSQWYSQWIRHSLFYANFFYGPLIALYCAYVWRVEHLNYNMKKEVDRGIQKAYTVLISCHTS